ncbi:3-deoxy-7-phosphoheptulonate synthase [Desulfovermiculus halophilus]|uniref:3-deoxy-7-phosphoheptulonate synthase n=1 Tax=Desulfovermiculus halophilus TaxID=339722 RepID=UPI00054F9413|nr:3-deoxy-7-phosphoheptulonate synthase [Desulfovermiculus halophilus]
MHATDDIRIQGYTAMQTPRQLKHELPLSAGAGECVRTGRKTIQDILDKKDRRLLVISGPCSIHDEEAALEYAHRLARLSREVDRTMVVVMRVYFEKPRTTVGWKGLINDPNLDDTCDIQTGLYRARRLLLQINELGLPVATEMLDPITPQYVADLVSWSAIGARTTESQTHRQMASGLSMPVGFKNSTDGNLGTAVNAMQAARAPQTFLGIDQDGQTCVVKTGGNTYGHVVLRGGEKPNYDPISIEETRLNLIKKGLPEAVIVDCSHANCHKKHQGQGNVFKNVLEQILQGNEAILGLMLESNLHEGSQKFSGDPSALEYGVSITDECISWETTEELLHHAHRRLSRVKLQAA